MEHQRPGIVDDIEHFLFGALIVVCDNELFPHRHVSKVQKVGDLVGL